MLARHTVRHRAPRRPPRQGWGAIWADPGGTQPVAWSTHGGARWACCGGAEPTGHFRLAPQLRCELRAAGAAGALPGRERHLQRGLLRRRRGAARRRRRRRRPLRLRHVRQRPHEQAVLPGGAMRGPWLNTAGVCCHALWVEHVCMARPHCMLIFCSPARGRCLC